MRRSGLLIIAAGLLVAASGPAPGADDRLQGTWYIVYLQRPGDKGGRESFDFTDTKFTLTFDHGIVTSSAEGKPLWQGTYRIDPGKTPGVIDITRRTGPFKHGIYQLNGDDTLKLCLDVPANPRPTNFRPVKDSKAEVTIFRREKPGS